MMTENENNNYLEDLVARLGEGDETAAEAQLSSLFPEESFGAGFADRVMAAIDDAEASSPQEHGEQVDRMLPRMFRWVVVAGAAAASVMLAMTWLTQDSLSIDAIAGISDISIDNVYALNLW